MHHLTPYLHAYYGSNNKHKYTNINIVAQNVCPSALCRLPVTDKHDVNVGGAEIHRTDGNWELCIRSVTHHNITVIIKMNKYYPRHLWFRVENTAYLRQV